MSVDYSFDQASRLTSIVNKKAGFPEISSFTYVLDPNGNRTRMTDTEGMTDYTYDPLERLRTVAYPGQGAITYGYDLGGNRTSASSPASAYTFDETDQMKTINGITNKFDKNGNLLYLGSAAPFDHTFLYDQENRLFRTGPCRADVSGDGGVNIADAGIIAARSGIEGTPAYDLLADINADGTINIADRGIQASENGKQCKSTGANTGNGRYWYNGDGLRVGSRTFSTTAPTRTDTDYVWDAGAGMPVVLQETNDPNNGDPVTTTYLYGLDLIASTAGAGAAVFYLSDGLGSTRELVTASGDVVDNYHYTYDAWGGLRSAQPATMNEFRFTGEQTDVRANRGLVYLRARFYDPAFGRFLNRDPLPVGNRYAYVDGNPANAVDPLGLEPDEPKAEPLPVAAIEDSVNRCIAAWVFCVDELAYRNGRHGEQRYRTICNEMLDRCTGRVTSGDTKYEFDMRTAERRMQGNYDESSSVSPFRAAVDWLARSFGRATSGLPDTGSGGYLPRVGKESNFACPLYFGGSAR